MNASDWCKVTLLRYAIRLALRRPAPEEDAYRNAEENYFLINIHDVNNIFRFIPKFLLKNGV